jgi:D-proline reductase (dithiol) PrdB
MGQHVHEVDPWRFAGGFIAKALGAGIPVEQTNLPIPWAPVSKPLVASRIALLTTAGISMKGDEPFDMEGERKRPTWGDPSWRRLRSDATSESVEVNHLHIDTTYIERDLNVALPLDRLRELAADGVVGEMAPTHYSIMGYQG